MSHGVLGVVGWDITSSPWLLSKLWALLNIAIRPPLKTYGALRSMPRVDNGIVVKGHQLRFYTIDKSGIAPSR